MNFNFIILLLVTFLVVGCNDKSVEGTRNTGGISVKPMMNQMETIEISKTNPLVMLKLTGELKPDKQTELFAKVNSYVKSIGVDIGDRVSAGQVLIVLEAPEIQSQVASAKAKLDAQEAIYLSTKSTYDRMLKANETQGAIAQDALDQIKARKLSDQAKLNAALSEYNESANINQYLVIKSPFNGVITSRNVDVGSYVGPMKKEPLLVVEDNQKLRLSLSVPEVNTPYIKLGDSIDFFVQSQPQYKYNALVSRRSGSLDIKLRSERIEADFMNGNQALKSYMVAETIIPLQNTESTFFVPKSAVVDSGIGVYVILVDDGKTKNIPVRKGRVMAENFEVFGLLKEGDKILKMASEEVREGTTIPVVENQ